MRTTTAGFSEFPGASGVGFEFVDFMEAAFQAFEELLVKGIGRRHEGIMDPKTILSRLDQAGFSEVGQMTRGRWLRDSDDLDEVADTKLALLKQMEDAQARRV